MLAAARLWVHEDTTRRRQKGRQRALCRPAPPRQWLSRILGIHPSTRSERSGPSIPPSLLELRLGGGGAGYSLMIHGMYTHTHTQACRASSVSRAYSARLFKAKPHLVHDRASQQGQRAQCYRKGSKGGGSTVSDPESVCRWLSLTFFFLPFFLFSEKKNDPHANANKRM